MHCTGIHSLLITHGTGILVNIFENAIIQIKKTKYFKMWLIVKVSLH